MTTGYTNCVCNDGKRCDDQMVAKVETVRMVEKVDQIGKVEDDRRRQRKLEEGGRSTMR
jgi:hypothetical protein